MAKMGNSVRCSASNGTKSLSFIEISMTMFEDISWNKEESWADYMDRTDSEVYRTRSEVYEYVLSELTTGEKAKQSETEASIKISSEERIQPTSAPAWNLNSNS